ncbi:MAG: Lipoprotein [Oscillospiraceae bacterium]
MKRVIRLFPACLLAAAALFLNSCSYAPDAGVLLREAISNANSITSCSTAIRQELVFTSNDSQHSYSSENQIIYMAEPFALKSVQKVQADGEDSSNETYTVTEGDKLFFYCKLNDVWQKTDAGNMDTSPAAQLDILRVLNRSENQKYVREMTLNSRKVHKIELKLSNEVLRSTVETIATVTGMTDNSSTVVQTLLNSAPDLYGYCYIDTQTGNFVRMEADLTDAINQIFQNIDGNSVSVHVTKCTISGNIDNIGTAPSVILPNEAKNASSIQAYG